MKLCRYNDNDQSKYMTIEDADEPVDVAMTEEKIVNCFIYILREDKNIIKKYRKNVSAFSK